LIEPEVYHRRSGSVLIDATDWSLVYELIGGFLVWTNHDRPIGNFAAAVAWFFQYRRASWSRNL